MKKLLFAALILFTATLVSANDPLKIGFIYVSPIGDSGWSFQHDQGRLAAVEKFADRIETTFIESIQEGQDAERVLRKLASSDYDMIFATSFGFMNPALKVAKAFPKVIFEHATGFKQAKNLGNYTPRFYEGRYLAGIAAGSKTQSNKIGYVAAFPIPEVVRGINAFTLGAQSVNPDVEVSVIWTNSWFDPSQESEAANSLIAQGADVLTHHTDSVAVVKAAKDSGKLAIAYHSDMQTHGGDAQIGAVIHVWDKFYIDKIQQALDGTWTSTSVWHGISEDLVDFKVTSRLDEDTLKAINSTRDRIRDGQFNPFTGPIVDQKGENMAADGEVLSDAALLQMMYFVKGVNGRLDG